MEVAIFFDYFPTEIGWALAGPCGMVAEVTPGHYDNYFRDGEAVLSFDLDVGQRYSFILVDAGGNGFCCPDGRVSMTIDQLDGTTRYLLRAADDFGESLSANFTVPGVAKPTNCTP